MGAEVYTIAASHDDAYYTSFVGCINEYNYLEIPVSVDGSCGLRFLNVPHAGGVKVLSAYLRFKAYNNGPTATFAIYGILQANPGAFETPNCNAATRPLTAASVTWATGARIQNNWYNTDDLSAVLQEVLDQAGRISGYAIAFCVYGVGSTADFYAYDSGAANAPGLYVTTLPKGQGYVL